MVGRKDSDVLSCSVVEGLQHVGPEGRTLEIR
jgi:hypothetical protein